MSSSGADSSSRLRVELFSDAVFAVAITLLVLELPLKDASGSLVAALADHWPAFAAFGISFVLIGCVWMSHYRLFRRVEEVDSPLLLLNLLMLFSVVLVPFGASTMATFLARPEAQSRPAAAVFAGVLALMSLCLGVLHVRVSRRSAPAAQDSRFTELRRSLGLLVNSAGVGVAFINPVAVLAMTGGVALYYLIGDVTGY